LSGRGKRQESEHRLYDVRINNSPTGFSCFFHEIELTLYETSLSLTSQQRAHRSRKSQLMRFITYFV
jgi:hypothetical protein